MDADQEIKMYERVPIFGSNPAVLTRNLERHSVGDRSRAEDAASGAR